MFTSDAKNAMRIVFHWAGSFEQRASDVFLPHLCNVDWWNSVILVQTVNRAGRRIHQVYLFKFYTTKSGLITVVQ